MSFKAWSQAQVRAAEHKSVDKGNAAPAAAQPATKPEKTPNQPAQLPPARKP
jgi:hypothetical protein